MNNPECRGTQAMSRLTAIEEAAKEATPGCVVLVSSLRTGIQVVIERGEFLALVKVTRALGEALGACSTDEGPEQHDLDRARAALKLLAEFDEGRM